MRTLAIDSATQACSVALLDENGLIAGAYELLGRGHAERLIPMIASLPGRGRADRISVSLGPGSFTGVRVGLAAARALALAWGAELTGFPTLALVAAMARREAGDRPVCTVMTGGHGEWFVQAYAANGEAAGDVLSLRPDEATRACTSDLVAGSEAEALVRMRGSGTALAILPDARDIALVPSASFTADVRPVYGRAPDARLPRPPSPS